MGTPQRESFDASTGYKGVLWIAGRDAQDWSLNEMQAIADVERQRLGNAVYKEGGVVAGLSPSLPGAGQLALSDGQVYLKGRVEPITGGTLQYHAGSATTAEVTTASIAVPIGVNPTTVGFASSGKAALGGSDEFDYTGVSATGFSGVTNIGQTWPSGTKVYPRPVETVFAKWLMDQITLTEDATLKSPTTGDVVEERIRVKATLATSSPDALDEQCEIFDGTVPRNWTLASGASAKGAPAKFGEQAVRLVHTNGTETRLEREIVLTPSTLYYIYFWIRTVAGKSDLSLAHGAFADIERGATPGPVFAPTDYGFATSADYVRKSFTVTADASANPVKIRFVIPAAAPSTELLLDAVLVTTAPLGALDLDRHFTPILAWDRATDTVARAVARASSIRMADLEPPLDGADIVNIEANPGLQDLLAGRTLDEHGHYRVPPGLLISRDTTRDTSALLGLLVSAGRAYVRGYRVVKTLGSELLIDKALSTAQVTAETQTFTVGTTLYPLAKAVGLDNFPIAAITQMIALVMEDMDVTRGSTLGGSDDLGAGLNAILAASKGTAGTLTGTATGPFAFPEANNTFKVTVSNFDGTAGAEQTLVFARGSYTIAEVLEALTSGAGRAYRSGKIYGNVKCENDGTGKLKISTRTTSASSTVTIGGAASTANALLGFTNGQTNTGTGNHYTLTTHYVKTGNAIDWSPDGTVEPTDEPTRNQTYRVTVRRSKSMLQNTDYRLGGFFAASATYHYKVATWGPNGEGLPSAAVNRVTPIGSLNKISWTAVTNAVSYHVYRSTDGTNFYFLKNVTGTSFVDDGSMTADTTKTPSTTQATTTAQVTTSSTAVPVGANPTSLGFAASGKAYLNGTDEFDYTGTDATGFTGVTNIGQTWNTGTAVYAGPSMGALTLAEDELGVVNWAPAGQDPQDGQSFIVDYTYYQPRVDAVTLDRFGTVAVVKGQPADTPIPPATPGDVLELGQVKADANATTVTIANSTSIDRPLVTDLRALMKRVDTLFQNDLAQQVLNQIETRSTAAKKGLFADAMATFDQHDSTHSLYKGTLEVASRLFTVRATATKPTLTVNAGPTTVVTYGQAYLLPSTEVVLIDQQQWSDELLVNPYSAFTPPPARLILDPSQMSWAIDPGGSLDQWRQASTQATLVVAQATTLLNRPDLPPAYRGEVERIRQVGLRVVADAVQVTTTVLLPAVKLKASGRDFGPNEDNIALTFATTPITVASHGLAIAPGGAGSTGTNPNTVKADAIGRFDATFTVPSAIAAGAHNVKAAGPVQSATAGFTGLTAVVPAPPGIPGIPSPPEPPPPRPVDPVAESFSFATAQTISGVGLYFTAKDATVPVTVQLRAMVAGFPGPQLVISKTLAPSEVNVDGTETKVLFDRYVRLPANVSLAVGILSASNAYKVQIATLGHLYKLGTTQAGFITRNPYEAGVLFSSSNAETWTAHQDSDLRFRVYGRQFSASGVLEFQSIAGTFTDLWLGTDDDVPAGTVITWEYELNGDGKIRPFGPRAKVLLDAVTTSVILRARFSTTDVDLSPAIAVNTLALVGFYNDDTGTYVSRMVEFSQNLSKARVYAVYTKPGSSTVAWYATPDDGANWTQMELDPTISPNPVALDTDWAEYSFRLPSDAAFGTAGKKFRLRAELSANLGGGGSRLQVPKLSQVGALLE